MSHSHQTVRLSPGRHVSSEEGVCVMELASMLAGEPFSDRPLSVSPTLAAILRGYNDGLDDARRQTLKRFAADAIGTLRGRGAEKERRRLIRCWLADGAVPRGRRGGLLRRLDAADPYSAARMAGKRVAARNDDELHARTLALLDAMVAAGARSTSPTLTPAELPATTPEVTPHA